MVLRKKEVYTIITPIPSFIPRQLAIDIFHSHGEVITVNPLVLSYKQIKAPRDAPSDEYYSTWYEITERIQYVPGMGRLGSGKLSFRGCFHDLPWGLQTHIYLPFNIDLRVKYRIAGNQPGVEPPEPPEIGQPGVPRDGLYLREDIEIRCNITMVGTVKSQMKAASKDMIERIIKKAELLDAGVLQAMIEDGRIKTFNPNDRTYTGGLDAAQKSPPLEPMSPYQPPMSPPLPYQIPRPMSPSLPYQVPRPMSLQQGNRPGTSGSLSYPAHWQQQFQQQNTYEQNKLHQQYSELPNSPVAMSGSESAVMELPGDYHHPQTSPHLQPPKRSPTNLYHDRSSSSSNQSRSTDPNAWRWSQDQPSPSLVGSSRPTSYSSDASSVDFASPRLDHKGFAAELATHPETIEEHHSHGIHLQGANAGTSYGYNPADYAGMRR
ncbi:hypothetical protein F4779DRAFT_572649 [Xylariaceae sp. FL0662B]|nr:hypothetical protein F4779DRAFT_572649 [Xylariaceae sp. FL0662B]